MAKVELDKLPLSIGKKTRLRRILYDHGPGNGLAMILPVDHGLEHGPVDFFGNPPSQDPDYILHLAEEGNYSAVVLQYGLAARNMANYAGRIPLILKVNGKTNIPSSENALSPQTATVEDAVRLGADAVGYTLYVGSPAQFEDFRQFQVIRDDCERFGMPLIVWAYPRGRAIEEKGGRDSLYAIDYAARVAAELGADLVKLNIPKFEEARMGHQPKPYDTLRLDLHDAVAKIVRSASGVPVLISGGGKVSDEEVLNRAKTVLDAGACGLIFGRNMFQRPLPEALDITRRIQELIRQAATGSGSQGH